MLNICLKKKNINTVFNDSLSLNDFQCSKHLQQGPTPAIRMLSLYSYQIQTTFDG